MSKDLSEVTTKKHVVDIVHEGEKMMLPNDMSIDEAIEALHARKEYLGQTVEVLRSYDVFPWDGACALHNVLSTRFGWAQGQTIPGGFFSPDQPPRMLDVEVGYRTVTQVGWGRFTIPGVHGYLETGVTKKNNRLCFVLKGRVARIDEEFMTSILNDIQTYLNDNSIYAGKAIKIRFRDDDGDPIEMPEPKFLNTEMTRDDLIYAEDVQSAIETNLFTPLDRIEDCNANGIPIKRGILLGGPYGTGKTLAATVAARVAQDNGITFIYVPRADELGDALEFAKQYQTTACVVFCEDIDRAVKGERSIRIDDILNILDGIDAKHNNIITVLTTNHISEINPAMLRPGRLDAVINVVEPDAKAAEKLVRLYGGDAIEAKEDLTEAGELLNGTIPAIIAEVVKRAKLVQLRLQEPGEQVRKISGKAIAESAATMKSQIDLLHEQQQPKDNPVTFERLMAEINKDTDERLNKVQSAVNAIIERIS